MYSQSQLVKCSSRHECRRIVWILWCIWIECILCLMKVTSKLCTRVLDNLKDYAVRALVNAVDHLGTVAYKLTDLLEQQTLDVSTMDLKVTCLNQVSSSRGSLLL